jgi:uncharacterized protein YbbC (DUF1343 family)
MGTFTFTPKSIQGVSNNPKFKNQQCLGTDLQLKYQSLTTKPNQINLSWLISYYKDYPKKEEFFIPFFEKLAGNKTLRKQIESGWTEEMIRNSWQKDLNEFDKKRQKYLIYKSE